MWISPNYRDTDFERPLSFDDKLTIFFDRVYGWQLDIANQCINGSETQKPIPHSGLGTLSIVLSYFEMIGKYEDGYAGDKNSEHYFKKGVCSAIPGLGMHMVDLEQIIEIAEAEVVDRFLTTLYREGRCGLYHTGMIGKGIVLTAGADKAMNLSGDGRWLVINPHQLVPVLIDHLKQYVKRLRDPGNETERENFERRFNYDNKWSD